MKAGQEVSSYVCEELQTAPNFRGLLLLVLLFVSIGSNTFSQKFIEIDSLFLATNQLRDSNFSIYVLGESHFENNLEHKIALIKYLHRKFGIKKIGLERSIGYEVFYNNYLTGGDTSIFSLTKYGIKYQYEQEKQLLHFLKAYNLTVPTDEHISIFCYDVPQFQFGATVEMLQKLFGNIKNIDSLNMLTIIEGKNTKVGKDTFKVADSLVQDFNTYNSLYQRILGDKYNLYASIIDGMEITYKDGFSFTIQSFRDRENYINNELQKRISSDEKSLILCGNTHANRKLNDDLVFGEAFSSFTSVLAEKYPKRVMSIGTQYYKRKRIIRFLREMNLLEVEMKELFKGNKDRFKLFSCEELKNHPHAFERYDMLLIKNCRRREKE